VFPLKKPLFVVARLQNLQNLLIKTNNRAMSAFNVSPKADNYRFIYLRNYLGIKKRRINCGAFAVFA